MAYDMPADGEEGGYFSRKEGGFLPEEERPGGTPVGIVDSRYWQGAGDDQSKLRAQFYYLFAQIPDGWTRRWSQLMSIAVRTSVPPLSLVEALRHELRGAAHDQVLYEVRPLEQLTAASLGRQRFLLFLFGTFAALSLALAAIGIYGVLAYLTGLRVPEFGVRMALGATARDVLGLVFRQSLGMIAAGVALGGCAAFGRRASCCGRSKGCSPRESRHTRRWWPSWWRRRWWRHSCPRAAPAAPIRRARCGRSRLQSQALTCGQISRNGCFMPRQ